jgi:hypothetical protein
MPYPLPSAPTSSPSPVICKTQRCSFMRKPIDQSIQASRSSSCDGKMM